jgi:hypothetical protein
MLPSIFGDAPPSTISICHKDYADLDCSEKVRQARQEGGDHGSNKNQKVLVENSVDYRVLQMLKFLNGKDEGSQPPAGKSTHSAAPICLGTLFLPRQ